eukprot:7945117-Ditylum_brightwellii.AAC.1
MHVSPPLPPSIAVAAIVAVATIVVAANLPPPNKHIATKQTQTPKKYPSIPSLTKYPTISCHVPL